MRKRTAHDCCLKFWFDQPNPLSKLSFKDLSHMHTSYFSADFVLKSGSNYPSTAPIHWSTFFSLPLSSSAKFCKSKLWFVWLSINHLPLLMQLNRTGGNSSLFQIPTHLERTLRAAGRLRAPSLVLYFPLAHLLVPQAASTSSFTLTVS